MERPDLARLFEQLAGEDLTVRQRLAETGELFRGYHPGMRAVHRRNAERLAAVLDELGCWPGHRLVGSDGSQAAFLIAQHDIANPAFMRRCRELYELAVDDDDADPVGLAQLEDRIRAFEGRRQWYGTQWGWNHTGQFGPWPPVDEPETVDARRARVGLPTLAEAIDAAGANRPLRRLIEDVRREHREADDFARQVGWRDDDLR